MMLLSPVLFPLEVLVGILPVLALTWLAGAIMLSSSRAWTAGQLSSTEVARSECPNGNGP
jgi:hypothetical protein